MRSRYFPVMVGSRVDEDTSAWLARRAHEERVSISTLIRRTLEDEAKRDLVAKGEGQDRAD
jgi:predicted HicB family RNase H-like nuclease